MLWQYKDTCANMSNNYVVQPKLIQCLYVKYYQSKNEGNRYITSMSTMAFIFLFVCFFFFIYFFNWRIIALQSCVGFCQISTWISHKYTLYALSLEPSSHLNPHPTRALLFVLFVFFNLHFILDFRAFQVAQR